MPLFRFALHHIEHMRSEDVEMGLLDGQEENEWMQGESVYKFLRASEAPQFHPVAGVRQPFSSSERIFLQHLKNRLQASNSVQHNLLWKDNAVMAPSAGQMFSLLTVISEHIRSTGNIGVDAIVRGLVSSNVFDTKVLADADCLETAYRAVFVAVGDLTMLYTTIEDKVDLSLLGLRVKGGNSHGISVSPTASHALRALSEFLRLFDDILPQNSVISLDTEPSKANAGKSLLLAPNMSLVTICRTAKLELNWVSNIGEHLVLDIETQKLSVFAFPSFCNVFTTDKSPFAILSHAYYEDWMRPPGMCGSKYVQEVLLSLAILLGNEKSRTIFKKREINRIRSMGTNSYDPTLEKQGKTNIKEAYSKTVDFPILAERLQNLQDYVNEHQPSRFMELWRDDRDLIRWYTLWVVIGLGAFGIFLALLQIAIGVTQTVITWKAYQAQLSQSGSTQRAA